MYWKITANSPESIDKITVYNDSDKTPSMKFCANTVILPSEGVTITAVYKKRPAVVNFTPADANAGKEKDSDIVIEFDQPVDLQSFKSGYKISCNAVDIKSFYADPVKDENNENVIIIRSVSTVDIGVDEVKKVIVTIPSNLYYTSTIDGTDYQIEAGEEKSYSYRINSNTTQKTFMQFSVDTTQVTVTGIKAGTEYNTDESFTLTVTEKDGYQFTGWIKTNDPDNKIQITKSEINSSVYTVKINGKAGSSSVPVTITAATKERLRVKSIIPSNDPTNGVPRDTGIKIYFNHAPGLELCKQKIGILCNGTSVKALFPVSGWNIASTPDSNGWYKLEIPADQNNRITVNGLSTIEVFFDGGSLYYNDGTSNIYYGGSGYSYEYTINEETDAQAKLAYSATAAQKTFTSSETINGSHSIEKEISVAFEPTADYEFLYWQSSDDTVVSFADRFQKNTKFTVNKGTTGNTTVTISAFCVKKPTVNGIQVQNSSDEWETPSTSAYPKDTNIKIIFNQDDDVDYDDVITADNFKTAMDVLCAGIDVYNNYTVELDDNVLNLTAKPNNRLNVTDTSNLVINLYTGFYYVYTDSIIGTKNIYLKQADSKSFKVDSSTMEKASIIVQDDNGTITEDNGQTVIGTNSWSKDQTFTLNFVPSSGYQFIKWSISGKTENITHTSINNKTLTVTIKDAQDGTVTITPLCAETLKITGFKVNGDDFNSLNTYPKDSEYTITFNIAPVSVSTGAVLYKGGTPVSSTYYKNELSGTTLTIKPNGQRFGTVTDGESLGLMINNQINQGFYYTDSVTGEKIYLETPYEQYIRINSTTVQKAKIKVDWDESKGTVKDTFGNTFSKSELEYSKDDKIKLSFVPNEDYGFVCWTISGTTGNVTMNSTNKAKMTDAEITVSNSSNGSVTISPYCVSKPTVTGITINGQEFNQGTYYPKDSEVIITLSNSLTSDSIAQIDNNAEMYFKLTEDKISTTNNITPTQNTQYYFKTKTSEDKTQIIFTPPLYSAEAGYKATEFKYLPLTTEGAESKIDVSLKDLCYTATYEGISKNIPINTYNFSYKIDYKSRNTFKIEEYESYRANVYISPNREGGIAYFGEEITIWYRRYGAEYQNSYVTRFSSYPETNALKENEITYILHDGREDDRYSPYYYYNKNKFIINQLNGVADPTDVKVYHKSIVTDLPLLTGISTDPDLNGSDLPCDTKFYFSFNEAINSNTICTQAHTENGILYPKTVGVITPLVNNRAEIINYNETQVFSDYFESPGSFIDITDCFEIISAAANLYYLKPKTSIRDLFADYERLPIFILMDCAEIKTQGGKCVNGWSLSTYTDELILNSVINPNTDYAGFTPSVIIMNDGSECTDLELYWGKLVLDKTVAYNSRYNPPYNDYDFYAHATDKLTPNLILTSKEDFTAHPEAVIADTSNNAASFNFFSETSYTSYGHWSTIDYQTNGSIEFEITPLYKWDGSQMKSVSKPSQRRIIQSNDVEDIHEIITFRDWGIDVNTVLRIDTKIYHKAFEKPYEASFYVYYGSF